MEAKKMNNYDFWAVLFASNKKLIVSIVIVFGGLITRESYFLLKKPGASKFKMFLARAVITFFLCLLLNSYIASWTPTFHFLVLGLFALSCIPILDWFLNSLLPAALVSLKKIGVNWLVNIADKYKNEEKNDQEGQNNE